MELLWKFSSSSGAIHSRLRVSGSTDLQPPLDQIIDEGTVKRVPRGLRSFTFVCSVHIINQQDKYLYNYFDLHRIYKLHPSNDRMLGLMFIISKREVGHTTPHCHGLTDVRPEEKQNGGLDERTNLIGRDDVKNNGICCPSPANKKKKLF